MGNERIFNQVMLFLSFLCVVEVLLIAYMTKEDQISVEEIRITDG